MGRDDHPHAADSEDAFHPIFAGEDVALANPRRRSGTALHHADAP